MEQDFGVAVVEVCACEEVRAAKVFSGEFETCHAVLNLITGRHFGAEQNEQNLRH